ncbi:ADP-ribosyltransferase [Bacillus sp. CDB3]|uniref:ADP-ribosyltransferase n=1 Tax=Bacillus sp. CDB3 TaxID=360310 RepID=UPI0009D81234|nr:ADP-ribosyltransferase [Bacillus sp. CDB3]OQR57297.1 hypothetical protein CDB3_07415 [Bacillus sp. CDB3]
MLSIKKKFTSLLVTSIALTGMVALPDANSVHAQTTVMNQYNSQTILDYFLPQQKYSATMWGTSAYKNWIGSIPSYTQEKYRKKIQIIDAFKSYTTDEGYSEINGCLRQNKPCTTNSNGKIKNMDDGFKHARVPDDIYVYRRATERDFSFQYSLRNGYGQIDSASFNAFKNTFLIGQAKQDRGYMSTTIFKDASPAFKDRPILMKLKIPRGFRGVYLDTLTAFPGEMELLLQRSSGYKITNIYALQLQDEKGYVVVEAEIKDNAYFKSRPKRSVDNYNDKLPNLSNDFK